MDRSEANTVAMTDKGTILVVDDTAISLKLLSDILTMQGYRVHSAESGERALALVVASPPELILLDILMPGINGFEVLRWLKAREASRDIPVIFLSGINESAQRVEGLKLGAVDFIAKPFVSAELLARVQTHLELRRLRVRLEQQADELWRANEKLQSEIAERTRAEQTLERKAMEIRELNVGLERRVRERTAELQAANDELQALVYSIAHDLRAPLRAIDGFSGILEKEYGARLDDEGRRLVGVVRAGAQGMDRLINALLEYTRLSGTELHRGPVDMAALVRNVFAQIAPEEVRRTFRFMVGPLPQAEGDTELLRCVWRNLLSNAVKFTLPRQERSIEVGGTLQGATATWWVRDSGVGFDQAYAHKLFGVFQRVHVIEEFAGTGIGLAIVRRIVSRHGGRVWAEGAVNAGATFFFSLPNQGGNHG